MIRNILITVLSELARKEREKIVTRVKAGIEMARQSGKKLGRPSIINAELLYQLRAKGFSYSYIAKELNIAKSTVHKYLQEKEVH